MMDGEINSLMINVNLNNRKSNDFFKVKEQVDLLEKWK